MTGGEWVERGAVKHSLFVISDLHLGGKPAEGDKPSFQMCTVAGQSRLASFIDWVGRQRSESNDVHLLINGDIVDFLAEEAFSSFTNGDDEARDKLKQAIKHTQGVWKALRDYVSGGGRLTLLLGNHDVELSLPAARRLLMETLGPGQVEFVYDNQAYVEGPVLIEHGNRYDGWNAISHGTLRAIRSALSRGEAPTEYLGPPGSRLVQTVMNPIKADYPFVDLLKPEGPGMVPILALLNPSAMKQVGKFAALAARSLEVQYDENGLPKDQQNIADYSSTGGLAADQADLSLAYEMAGIPDAAAISAWGDLKGLMDRLKDSFSEAVREREVGLLLKALRNFAKAHRQAFNVNEEDEVYLRPARVSIARGFKAVIYGHTHLVKRVRCDDGALYLNTGTWADLMRMPEGILTDNEDRARVQLKRFLSDLQSRKLEGWRRQVPTFARVEYDGNDYLGADVYLFDGTRALPVPDGRLTLLDYAD